MSLKGARVLVTGATGFIGSHMVQRLIGEEAQVFALRRVGLVETLRRLPAAFARYAIEWHEVDLRTYGSLAHAVSSIVPQVVLHLAAAGVTDPFLKPDAAIRANVYGTINLLRAVKGQARVIVARTPGEMDALNVYAASKAAAWSFCEMYRRTEGWPLVAVMPFQVYGPRQSARALIPAAVRAALRDEDFPLTPGEQQRDWVYIDDVVEAILRVATQEAIVDETIEVGSGHIAAVSKVVEQAYRYVDGSGKPLIGVLPARPGEVQRQAANVDRTAELIGWRAKATLEEGLWETIRWERQQLTNAD